ncbi:hypothetical protein AC629_42040 [Bradyrhizobium sp. NAS80.1]|nr:hypothetical protein AC629_42040 [Bradyrhizobium sp. NAS80.1]
MAAIIVPVAHTAQCFVWRLYGAGSYLEMASGRAARFAVLAFFLLSGRLITASIAAIPNATVDLSRSTICSAASPGFIRH